MTLAKIEEPCSGHKKKIEQWTRHEIAKMKQGTAMVLALLKPLRKYWIRKLGWCGRQYVVRLEGCKMRDVGERERGTVRNASLLARPVFLIKKSMRKHFCSMTSSCFIGLSVTSLVPQLFSWCRNLRVPAVLSNYKIFHNAKMPFWLKGWQELALTRWKRGTRFRKRLIQGRDWACEKPKT